MHGGGWRRGAILGAEPTGRTGPDGADDAAGVRLDLERRRADAANARAARATQRAAVAEQRAGAAEERLAALLSSRAWRVTWPLRRLASAIPGPLYRRLAGVPAEAPLPEPKSREPLPTVTLAPVLLVDDNWPRPDRDAGSIEIVNLAEALAAEGYMVHLAVDESRSGLSAPDAAAARAALEARGLKCLSHLDSPSLEAFLRRDGGRYRMIVLNRVYCGGGLFERVRSWCPDARVVFNTIDLHHVRIAREAAMSGDAELAAIAEATRAREEMLAAEADATFVVSDTERDSLRAAQPRANVFVLPLARLVHAPRTRFADRAGVGFIGGFAHAPNLDAVRFFLAEVWPLVLQDWPECRFSIVGADLPAELLGKQDGRVKYPGVEYMGAVPDVGPWFERLRLTVAPLRFGAGVKGKVVSSLAAGVPCVVTGIAAEGMGLRHGVDALLADDAAGMARQILRLRDDEGLWNRLSAGGMAHVAGQFSPAAWRLRLRQALWTIDALPGDTAGPPCAAEECRP